MFSILRNNKKGALELSMNAIVIIVLAFAMLGLGLVFTRTLLNQATQGAGQVTDTAKQQILDSLREGNKKMSVQQTVKLTTSDATVIGLGLKNTLGVEDDFTVSVSPPTGYSIDTDGKVTKDEDSSVVGTFVFNNKKHLTAEESDVVPIRFSSATKVGTTLFTITVTAETLGTDKPYATSDLFITIQ